MPGAGRPPIDNPRCNTIRVMVTDSELLLYRLTAERQALSLSEWLREAAAIAVANPE